MSVVIRLIGGMLVMVSCAGLGIYFSLKDSFRINDLTELKKALLLLKGEIEFTHSPLPAALVAVAERSSKRGAEFFTKVIANLGAGSGMDAAGAWKAAVRDKLADMNFLEEDLLNIERLGETMGHISKSTQAEGIDMAILYIDGQVSRLRETEGKNKRLYRSAGVIFGLLINIILI